MRSFLKNILFLTIFFFPIIIIAEETAFHGDGATPFAVKANGVQLEKETVKIYLSNSDAPKWTTNSELTFYNPAARPVEVTMELPNWKAFSSEEKAGEWSIRALTVESSVSAVPVQHTEIKIAQKQRPYAIPGNNFLFYDGGYRWTLSFEPRSRITLKMKYEFGGFSSSRGVDNLLNPNSPFSLLNANYFWKKPQKTEIAAPKNPSDWDFNQSHYRTVAYLTSTGSTWSGKIKSTDISIQMPSNVLPHLLVPQPKGYEIRNGMIHWHFKNWKPRHDVFLVQLIPQKPPTQANACPYFNTLDEAKAWLSFSRYGQYDRTTLEAVKNTALAKYGFVFPTQKWQSYFQKFEWYQADRSFSLDKLSPKDKAILSVLEEAEKRLAE